MNHEDGADAWGSQRPETPPWDAAEYNQLISAGPLLPLLEQYVSIGMMHDQKKGAVTMFVTRKRHSTYVLQCHFSQVLMTTTLLGGPRGRFSHKTLTLTNVRAANFN